ncbi:DUF4153 domain-containing protein [Kaistella palustris]|uniref:DUF4153 domain-containing protein n=1 Tax=Kaistella palustris TaxID=493376 RepID=UPI0004032E32|nr:DUF4153 domain-containing protein [Kaistella palustris]
MRQKLKNIFGKSDEILLEYPMVLLMALLGALGFITAYDDTDGISDQNFSLIKFGIVASLGISLMFGLKMLSERIGKRMLLELCGVLSLVAFYFILPAGEKDFTEPYAYLLCATFILSHLLASFIAFFGENKELNFWQYNKNLFIYSFLTAVFTGVLVGGVELAILAVDRLFDFNFDGRYYLRTFYFLAIFGSCFIFLLFNEKGLKDLEKDGKYPEILKFFTQYILIPLLIIYAVILYFYSAKILVNWELPRGWVSYLVLAYAVVGVLALLLVHPLKGASSKSWVRIFSKIFYFTLLPLLVLLFTAIFTRILEYGYTEPRYFVLILALWLTAVVLYFIFLRRTTIKFIPVSLFVFGVFALVFPYFNVFSVAKRSQKNELQKILSANNLLENGKIVFSKKISATVADEIASKYKFLYERRQTEFLKQFLTVKEQKLVTRNNLQRGSYQVGEDIRNSFTSVMLSDKNSRAYRLELLSVSTAHSVEGYEYMIVLNDLQEKKALSLGNETVQISTQRTGRNELKIVVDGEIWDITPFFREMLQKQKGKSGSVEIPEISTEKSFGKFHLKLVFDNLVSEDLQHHGFYYNPPVLLIHKK